MIATKSGTISRPFLPATPRSLLQSRRCIKHQSAVILSSLVLFLSKTAASISLVSFVWPPAFSDNDKHFHTTATKFNPFIRSESRRSFPTSSLAMAKLESPSAERNKGPIWDILSQKVFSSMSGKPLRILEIAAGSGVHVDHFSTQLSAFTNAPLTWYPTDPDLPSRNSIESYLQDGGGKLKDIGVQPPMSLTLDQNGIMEAETIQTLFPNGNESLDLMICINMIHISPWVATLGLLKLAGERLDADSGVLFCYGPYKEGGTAVDSNLDFDKSLKSRNPLWGVRDLEEVHKAASEQGLELVEKIAMPANNLSLIFRKVKKN